MGYLCPLAVGAGLLTVALSVGFLIVSQGSPYFAAKQGPPRPGGDRAADDPRGGPRGNLSQGSPYLAAEQGPPRPGGNRTADDPRGDPRGNHTAVGPRSGAPAASGARAGKYNLLQIGGPWREINLLLKMLLADLPSDLLPQGGDCDVLFLTGWSFSLPALRLLNRERPPRPRRNPEVVFIVNQENPTNEFVWSRMVRVKPPIVTHALILGNWWNSTHAEYSDENVTSLWVPFGSLSFAARNLSTPMNLSSLADASWRRTLQACGRKKLPGGQGGPPTAVAYLQRSCSTARVASGGSGQGAPWDGYRERFWDELNRRMLKELDTRGTALGACNGNASLGARAGPPLTPSRRAQITLPKGCGSTMYDEAVALYAHFKVAVTLENTISGVGYITEKVVNSLLAGAVPVYAGSRHISAMFNPGSYFFLEPGKNDAQVIASVIETLRNDSLYTSMLRQKVLSDGAMRRFFSWHPAVWPTHGDSLRRRIVGELRRHCRGHSSDVRLL